MNFESVFPMRVCLNLARRQDRRAAAEEMFYRSGLNVERWPAVDVRSVRKTNGYQTPGRYAHALSTRLIIREAKRRRAPAVFIFEDDISLLTDWRERLEPLGLPSDWGMFYLGCQHYERPEVVQTCGSGYSGLVRVHAALDTHAWGLRACHYDQVLSALNWRRHDNYLSIKSENREAVMPAADISLARLHDCIPAYAPFPQVAGQTEDYSDLLNGTYSNYWEDCQQKTAEDRLTGVLAEVLGGKSYEPEVNRARERRAWFQEKMLPIEECMVELDTASAEAVAAEAAAADAPPPLKRTAFLFLVRQGLNHQQVWEEYFSAAGNDARVYSHAKERVSVAEQSSPGWWRDSLLEEHVETAWGDISLVRAHLALLRAALTDPDNEHFMLLSESCIPVRPFHELRRLLFLDRRSRFHFEDHETVKRNNSEKSKRPKQAAAIPESRWRFHSQWQLLNRGAAELLSHDDLTVHWERVFAAEEAYSGTLLEAKGYSLSGHVAPHTVTWMKWGDKKAHPATFGKVSPRLAADLAASGCFFARKFSPESNIGDYGLHR